MTATVGSPATLTLGAPSGKDTVILRTPCGRSPLRSDLTPKHILILTVETNEAVPVDGAIRFARITPKLGIFVAILENVFFST